MHHLLDARSSRLGQHAERIAVEVDHPSRQIEPIAQRREHIFGIECQAVIPSDHHGPLSTARTGGASAFSMSQSRGMVGCMLLLDT
jgi:hypothetical protein